MALVGWFRWFLVGLDLKVERLLLHLVFSYFLFIKKSMVLELELMRDYCKQIFSYFICNFFWKTTCWWFPIRKSESGLVNTQNHQVNTHPACTAVSPQGSTEQRSNGAFHFEFCRLQKLES